MKIFPLSLSKSALSMPGPLGLDPTKRAASTSENPSVNLSVHVIPANKGKAQSYNSMATPFKES